MEDSKYNEMALLIDKKNRALKQIMGRVKRSEEISKDKKESMLKIMDNALNDSKLFDDLTVVYKSTNPKFVNALLKKYPDLTKGEINHCIYIKLGLGRKQISEQMGITINGIRNARNRMRAKMKVPFEIHLDQVLIDL